MIGSHTDGFDVLGTYSNVAHAVHNFAWSQLKKSLDSCAVSHSAVNLLVSYRQKMEALERYMDREFSVLQEAFPGPIVPLSVLETAHGLLRRRDAAHAAVTECDIDLPHAREALRKQQHALEKAAEQFRKTAIELAEVPIELRTTAKCRITDLCSGEAKVYFGEDGIHDADRGCRLVRADGRIERIREPLSHHQSVA